MTKSPEPNALRAEGPDPPSRSFRVNLLINGSLILLWYCFSTGLSLYNKWLFGKSTMNFSFPLFTSGLHMAIQFLLAGAIMLCLPGQRPRRLPRWRDYLSKVLPCAVATGLDIGLSNLSLRTITLSFYTMCKSSSLAFVLLFAFAFGLETPRLSLVGIIAMISVGVFLMAASEVDFVLAGFVQVMLAAAMSGLRWSLTQILLQDHSIGISTPIASMFFLSPLMSLCLFAASMVTEDLNALADSTVFTSGSLATVMALILVLGGVLATLMVTAEYQLIARTSVVTLSVAGIFKEVVTIALSSITFKDRLTPLNLFGLAVTLLGIGIYKWMKLRTMHEDSLRADGADYKPVGDAADAQPLSPGRYLPHRLSSATSLHTGDLLPSVGTRRIHQAGWLPITDDDDPVDTTELQPLDRTPAPTSRFRSFVSSRSGRGTRALNGFVPLDTNLPTTEPIFEFIDDDGATEASLTGRPSRLA
ncbi:hypothetical protein IWQ60_009310 [Tieghemiomyces parasiticus]|uniref:Sugar phosphate transporter domain-containing protein n=1 Tax=Tieghemiomyces parasiticus TaxID=78921 RepID=A0A9W7ZTJ0_9FUNG|nr:hypothetical protein IWQ60_009310 [Tieghemiomyces parasiticus]